MKKTIIIVCILTVSFYIYSNETKQSTSKSDNVIKYFKIAKTTDNISIGLSIPAIIISELFFLQYFGSKYYLNYYYDKSLKAYSDTFFITSWTTLSLGLSMGVTSILLSIFSNIFEKKATRLSGNDLNYIPTNILPRALHKKMITCGLIFVITGALIILKGIISTAAHFGVKLYTDLNAGENETYPILISGFVMGGILSITSIALFIPGGILKWKQKIIKTTLEFTPLITISEQYASFGIVIKY